MDKSALIYPYLYKHIELGRLVNPIISLSVRAKWVWQNLWLLVDSGADVTMLTLTLAKKLGFSYNTVKKTKLFGIGEKSIDAYLGEIMVKFGRQDRLIRAYFIDAEDSTLLLGRLDIFDHFRVCFDPGKSVIEFKPLL